MGIRLVDANCVVAARSFNLTLVNQVWMVRHGLIGENEVGEDWAFTPVFAQVITPRMGMIVTPEQLQFRPTVPDGLQQELVLSKVGKFVSLLPHTPYVGLGLNFHYQLTPAKTTVEAFTRLLFFTPGSPLHGFFDAPDARFGGYLSKDALGCRMKLDVKPVYGQMAGEDKPGSFVLMAFNFHHDLEKESDPAKRVAEVIAKWDEAKRLSHDIVQAVAEKGSL